MIQKNFTCFHLGQIADSGQCFRMLPCPGEENTYTVVSKEHVLKISQDETDVKFFCREEEYPFWEEYFDLKTDYGAFLAAVDPADSYLKRAAEFGRGIRILRQDPWEMIITFIISQQKTIPAIRGLVETLCRKYGTKLAEPDNVDSVFSGNLSDDAPVVDSGNFPADSGHDFYSFPTPDQLSAASLEDLLSLKLGYRAKYIKRVCEDACEDRLDLSYLNTLSYRDAMEYLMGFYGIGEKVANCICLFGLHHINAFPIDTWIKKILLSEYAPKSHLPENLPKSRLFEAIAAEHFSRYDGFAGVMQQYIFFYERMTVKGRPLLLHQ